MIFWKYINQYHVTLFIIVVMSVKMKIYAKRYIKFYYQWENFINEVLLWK